MAKQERKDRHGQGQEEVERRIKETGEVGGFGEEARLGVEHGVPKRPLPGRTIGDTATSYSSVGGAEEPDEWPERIPGPDEKALDYEMPVGAQPEAGTGPVHDVSFRPAPGGYVETIGRRGRDVPFTGEVISTRGSTFEEDPDTGRTAAEEEGEFLLESLEERTRGYESG